MPAPRARTLGVVLAILVVAAGGTVARSSAPVGFASADFEPSVDPATPVVLGGSITYVGRGIRARLEGAAHVVRAGREVPSVDGIVVLRAGDRLEPAGAAGPFSLSPIVPRAVVATPIAGATVAPRFGHGDMDEAFGCPYAPSLDSAEDGASLVSVDLGREVQAATLEVRSSSGAIRDRRELGGRSGRFRLLPERGLAPDADDATPLRVRLGDVLSVSSPVNGVLRTELRVDGGRCARRTIRVAIHVVPADPGGLAPTGITRAASEANLAAMIDDTNRALGSCGIAIAEATPRYRIVSPPPPHRLAIAEGDGLPTRAASEATLRVDGRRVSRSVPAASTPLATATLLAAAIRETGFDATVLPLPRLDRAADASADVVVRRRNGELATLTPFGDLPLLGDLRQRLRIGRVDFADGLEAMDTDRAATGTLEERSLLGAAVDDDPTTIDVVVVESFGDPTRMGEAFVVRDAGPWSGTIVLTRAAIEYHASVLTLPHEIGHLLLDDPYHPSTQAVGRFARIMASAGSRDASAPSTFVQDECERMRRSGARFFVP